MKQIYSTAVTENDTQKGFDVPVGSWEGLRFEFTGTAETGETVALADFGDMVFDDGNPHSKIDFASIIDRADGKGGSFDQSSIEADAFSFAIKFPFALEEDEDGVYRVVDNQIAHVDVFFATSLAAKITTVDMQMTVFAIPKVGVQNYKLRHSKQVLALQSGENPFVLKQKNIAELWLENNSNISRIFLDVNDRNLYNCPRLSAVRQSHEDNRIETYSASINKFELRTQRRSILKKYINKNTTLTVDASGGANVTLYIVYLEYTAEEQVATAAEDVAEDNRLRAIADDQASAVISNLGV